MEACTSSPTFPSPSPEHPAAGEGSQGPQSAPPSISDAFNFQPLADLQAPPSTSLVYRPVEIQITAAQLERAIPSPPADTLSDEPVITRIAAEFFGSTYRALAAALIDEYGFQQTRGILDTIEHGLAISDRQPLERSIAPTDILTDTDPNGETVPKVLLTTLLLLRSAEEAIRGAAAYENFCRSTVPNHPHGAPFLRDSIPQLVSRMLEAGVPSEGVLTSIKGIHEAQVTNHPNEIINDSTRLLGLGITQELLEEKFNPSPKGHRDPDQVLCAMARQILKSDPLRPTMTLEEEGKFRSTILSIIPGNILAFPQAVVRLLQTGVRGVHGEWRDSNLDITKVPLREVHSFQRVGFWIGNDADGNPAATNPAAEAIDRRAVSTMAGQYLTLISSLKNLVEQAALCLAASPDHNAARNSPHSTQPQPLRFLLGDQGFIATRLLKPLEDETWDKTPSSQRILNLQRAAIELDERLSVAYHIPKLGEELKMRLLDLHELLHSVQLGERGQGRWSSTSINKAFDATFGPLFPSQSTSHRAYQLTEETQVAELNRLLSYDATSLRELCRERDPEFSLGRLLEPSPNAPKYLQVFPHLRRLGRISQDLVISNCESPLEVLKAALLHKLVADSPDAISIVPLFESATSVRRAPHIIATLCGASAFMRGLVAASKTLRPMFGPSDLCVNCGATGAHALIIEAWEGVTKVFDALGPQVKTGLELGLGSSRGRLGQTPHAVPWYRHNLSSIRTTQGFTVWKNLASPVGFIRSAAPRSIYYNMPKDADNIINQGDIEELRHIQGLHGGPYDLIEALISGHQRTTSQRDLASWRKVVGAQDVLGLIARRMSSRPPQRPSDDALSIAHPLENLRAIPAQQIGTVSGTEFINWVSSGQVLGEAIKQVGSQRLQRLYEENKFFKLHVDRLCEVVTAINMKTAAIILNPPQQSDTVRPLREESASSELVDGATRYQKLLEEDLLKLKMNLAIITRREETHLVPRGKWGTYYAARGAVARLIQNNLALSINEVRASQRTPDSPSQDLTPQFLAPRQPPPPQDPQKVALWFACLNEVFATGS